MEKTRDILTPKIINFQELILETKKQMKKPAILLTTGSFNPIHRGLTKKILNYLPFHKGHIQMLLAGKQYLEDNCDYKILQILISPSCDEYLFCKAEGEGFRNMALKFEDRCKLIELSIQEYFKTSKENNIVFVDKWEGSQPFFIDFPSVWQITQEYFQQYLEEIKIESEIEVIYCIGSDMLKTSIDRYHKNALVVIHRKQAKQNSYIKEKIEKYQKLSLEEQKKIKLFFVTTEFTDLEISSSLLRSFYQKKQEYSSDIKGIMDEAVYQLYAQMLKQYKA